MEEVKLGQYGTLETFAVMRVGTSDFPPPYIMGYVKMKEGVSVFALITGCEARDDTLELGEEMELVVERVKTDTQGNNLIGWKFSPVKGKIT
jgi:uncharacterized OB-fold protein